MEIFVGFYMKPQHDSAFPVQNSPDSGKRPLPFFPWALLTSRPEKTMQSRKLRFLAWTFSKFSHENERPAKSL
jgi:hypothetical protein